MLLPLAFGLGSPTDIAIIAGVIVLLFGGSKIAGFGKSLGTGIKDFKKAVNEEDEAPAAATPVKENTSAREA